MLLNSRGKYRVVLQQYETIQVFCIIKVLPDATCFFDEEPKKDFNWMTATRWAKLENILSKLISKISNLKHGAGKLNTDVIFDHIKVTIRVEKDRLPAARQLLQCELITQNDIVLDIELKYTPHSDTFVNAQPTKRARVLKGKDVNHGEVDSSSDNSSSPKKNAKTSETPAKNKDKLKEPQKSLETISKSRKRERRSVSQDGRRVEYKSTSKNVDSESKSRKEKRSKSPRANSAESKRERPFRSPTKPSRYNEFILGNHKNEKDKTETNTISSSEKRSKKVSSNTNKKTLVDKPAANTFEQLDGAHLNVDLLEQLNTAISVKKPREVKILLLNDMDEKEVLKSFEKFRVDFNVLFEERQHKFETTNYMAIDHCHIMDIMSKPIRESMIKKLGNAYSKTGPHGSLVLNGLLPLWVIRLFMDKFKFTKEEAALQIADQLKYHTYLKALNNDPLSSDLED